VTDSEGKAPFIVPLSKKVGTKATTPITGSWRSLAVAGLAGGANGCVIVVAVFGPAGGVVVGAVFGFGGGAVLGSGGGGVVAGGVIVTAAAAAAALSCAPLLPLQPHHRSLSLHLNRATSLRPVYLELLRKHQQIFRADLPVPNIFAMHYVGLS
jgi:hypothetical protein